MNSPKGVVMRVLLVSVLGVLGGGVLMFLAAARVTAGFATERAYALNDQVREYRVAQCLADPRGWNMTVEEHQAYAYSASTRLSANPDAPALDRELLAELESSSAPMVSTVAFPPTGGAMISRFGPPGPCELLGVNWQTPPINKRRGLVAMVLVLVVVLVGVTALAILAAIRPLLRRIEHLARRAEAVGDAEAFAPLDASADDALGRLAHTLTRSHERIVAANDALRRRTTALEEHLENVAHDVRTPLSALQLRLEGLRTEAEGTPAQPRLTASIDDVVYLTQLTENLRLASRLEHGLAGSERERQQDLGEIVRRVVARFATLGDLRAVKVRGSWPDEPVPVACDPAAAEQALANLAHNAVMHAHSEVTLALDRIGDRFELVVVDDGPGVAPQSLPRLAERHFREDRARSRGPSGSGLGLAIVAEVCDRFEWTLAFEVLDPPGLGVTIEGGVPERTPGLVPPSPTRATE